MTLTHKKPTGLLRVLLRAPIWLYRLNLGWLLGRRLPADKETCRKVAESVPLISLTPTG